MRDRLADGGVPHYRRRWSASRRRTWFLALFPVVDTRLGRGDAPPGKRVPDPASYGTHGLQGSQSLSPSRISYLSSHAPAVSPAVFSETGADSHVGFGVERSPVVARKTAHQPGSSPKRSCSRLCSTHTLPPAKPPSGGRYRSCKSYSAISIVAVRELRPTVSMHRIHHALGLKRTERGSWIHIDILGIPPCVASRQRSTSKRLLRRTNVILYRMRNNILRGR